MVKGKEETKRSRSTKRTLNPCGNPRCGRSNRMALCSSPKHSPLSQIYSIEFSASGQATLRTSIEATLQRCGRRASLPMHCRFLHKRQVRRSYPRVHALIPAVAYQLQVVTIPPLAPRSLGVHEFKKSHLTLARCTVQASMIV